MYNAAKYGSYEHHRRIGLGLRRRSFYSLPAWQAGAIELAIQSSKENAILSGLRFGKKKLANTETKAFKHIKKRAVQDIQEALVFEFEPTWGGCVEGNTLKAVVRRLRKKGWVVADDFGKSKARCDNALKALGFEIIQARRRPDGPISDEVVIR
jgi:hypothetical protein